MFLDHPDPPLSSCKIVRKTLIFTILRLMYDFLSLKNYVNVPSKVGSLQKNLDKKYFLLVS